MTNSQNLKIPEAWKFLRLWSIATKSNLTSKCQQEKAMVLPLNKNTNIEASLDALNSLSINLSKMLNINWKVLQDIKARICKNCVIFAKISISNSILMAGGIYYE